MIAGMDSTRASADLRTPHNDEIPTLLAALAESGESLLAFARSRGLSTWKLYKARRQGKPEVIATAIFDPVRIVGASLATAPIELEHSSGHRLRIPPGFDETTLLRLIEVLESC